MLERLEGFVPILPEIHFDAVDQILECGAWKPESDDMRPQMLPLAGQRLAAFVEPGYLFTPLQECDARIDLSRLVDRVVHSAAEVPDTQNGVALVGRQRQKRVVEARRARAHCLLAEVGLCPASDST